MIIEMYFLEKDSGKAEDLSSVTCTLTPENQKEEEIIRNAKILHKNQLLVWWGDTIELEHNGKFIGYSGLKVCFKIPKP